MHTVRTMAADITHKEISKKLTTKQWIVYYYLMSICDWNGKDNERHYYLYKNKLNISAAARLLNMSRTTIHNTINKLLGTGKDEVDKREDLILKDCGDYYIVKIPNIYAEIHQKTLSFLIPYQSILGVDLIRTYAILCRIKQHPELPQRFTKATLLSILGHSINDTSMYYQMELYLGFLAYWHLVDLKIEIITTNVGTHREFLLTGIHPINKDQNFTISSETAVNQEIVDTIRNELINEGYWDIVKE